MDGLAVKFLEEEGYGAPPLFLGCGKNDLREEEESGRETDVRMGKREREREMDPARGERRRRRRFLEEEEEEEEVKQSGKVLEASPPPSPPPSFLLRAQPVKKVSMYHGRTRGKDKGAPKRTEKVIAFVRSLSSRGARVGQLIQKMELSWIRIDYTRDRGGEAGGLSFSAQGKQEKLFWFGREYMYLRFTFVTRG